MLLVVQHIITALKPTDLVQKRSSLAYFRDRNVTSASKGVMSALSRFKTRNRSRKEETEREGLVNGFCDLFTYKHGMLGQERIP